MSAKVYTKTSSRGPLNKTQTKVYIRVRISRRCHLMLNQKFEMSCSLLTVLVGVEFFARASRASAHFPKYTSFVLYRICTPHDTFSIGTTFRVQDIFNLNALKECEAIIKIARSFWRRL